MALIYRAHFAFSKTPRINSKGQSTGATFGFVNTLLDVLKTEKPTHLGVAFDTDAPTFRHIAFPNYKAQRQAQPEDIQLAIPYVHRILEAFRIPAIQLDGFEADDVIGTLAHRAGDAGYTVYMMTPDKDYGQLVRDHIFLYKPSYQGKGVDVMGPAEICARWDIERVGQVCDILGLMGDAVDNVPGIPGVGEKTAVKLIKEYGTVENLLDHAGEIKGRVGENLQNFAEQGRLSKQLICIDTNVPVAFDEEALRLKEWDKKLLGEVFDELEFRSLSTRLLGSEVSSSSPAAPRAKASKVASAGQMDLFGTSAIAKTSDAGGDDLPFLDDGAPVSAQVNEDLPSFVHRSIDVTPHRYVVIDNKAARQELCGFLLEQKEYCFDTETDSIDPRTAGLVGLSFSYRKGEAYYVPVHDEEEAKEILEDFRPAFESSTVMKIAQNIKYDMTVLACHGIRVCAPTYDTMLAHYLLEPDQRHGMDALASTYLNYTPVPIEDLIGKKGKGQLTMREVPIGQVKEYAAEDADITYQLKQILAPEIDKMGLDELLLEVEMPLVEVLSDMEREGVKIDMGALKELSILLGGEAKIAEEKIYEDAGERFNVGSPKQLGEILFDKLRLDDRAKKTPSGQYATGEDVLTRLAAEHAIAADILEYRQIVKLKNTYIDSLPEIISPKTGRVHTSFNQAVAATGRLSSTGPNLQNIPIRTDRGKEIRKAFVARDANHRIVSADYSQIELRIMASFSGDETMIEAFRQNKDIHAITAGRLYHIPTEEVTRDQRNKAKTANFGIIYGISAFGLAQRLKIPRAEASEIIKNYFLEFPAVKTYMDNCIEQAREMEYVTTMLGRRRYLRDINSRNTTLQGFAERNAINAPIQGSAADMIKIAMIRIHKWLEKEKLKTKMILQVHDELVFDAPVEELDIIKAPIVKHMAEALILKVPIEVGFGVGVNWLDAH